MGGISGHIKEASGGPLTPSEDTAGRHHLWVRKLTLTRHQICPHLDLGLLTPRTVSDNFC